MPRTAHRLKDFLTAPFLDPGLIDTFDSSDSLLPYRPEPLPDLIKVEPEITEISVELKPGPAIEAKGPFDPDWYEEVAEGEKEEFKPVEKEPEPEPEKKTQEETQEETDSDWSNVSRQKADRQNLEVDPSTSADPTTPGPTFTETITEARSGGGGLLLLALAALLGD